MLVSKQQKVSYCRLLSGVDGWSGALELVYVYGVVRVGLFLTEHERSSRYDVPRRRQF